MGGDSFSGTVRTAAVVESRADVRTVLGRLGQPNAGSSLPVQRRKGLRARVGVGEREREKEMEKRVGGGFFAMEALSGRFTCATERSVTTAITKSHSTHL